MQAAVQEAIAKAFSVISVANAGLVATLALIAAALVLGALAAAGKDVLKRLVEQYIVAAFVFVVAPLLAYALGYYWTLLGIGLCAIAAALWVWQKPARLSRAWIPALLTAIPLVAIALWEQGHLDRLRREQQPPTIAVLMFENKSLTARDEEIENAWYIFADSLAAALRPVSRIKVQPLKSSRDQWERVGFDTALEQLATLGVFPDTIIVSDVKPLGRVIRLLQSAYTVSGAFTKLDFAIPPEEAPIEAYEQLALRQVARILPQLKGDVALSRAELDAACVAILQAHLRTLPLRESEPVQLATRDGTCPGIARLTEILGEGLVAPDISAQQAARTANYETAVAVATPAARSVE